MLDNEWTIMDNAITAIYPQLGSDPASEAFRGFFDQPTDPKDRELKPKPAFIIQNTKPESADMEQLLVDAVNASKAWPEDIAAVVRIIRRAFEAARG
jgi:hypothetical protein